MNRLQVLLALSMAFFALSAPGTAAAQPATEEEIELLREQIRVLSERLDALERRSAAGAPAAVTADTNPASAGASANRPAGNSAAGLDQVIDKAVDERVAERMAALEWAERIRWSGDFRYRYENIQSEGRDDRNRNRIRARAALEARISDTVRVGLGLASGSEDPVSTNQTLGGGGSHKPLNIDLAYFEWTGLRNTAIIGGKFKNPLERVGGNALVWDSDWRPEGFAFVWDNETLFANGLGTWIESDSNADHQEFSFALQGGANLSLTPDVGLMAGVGYYDVGSAGKGSFFGDGDFFGNSFDPVGQRYLFDYRMIEAFAELSLEGLGRPFTLFGDYVTNLDADDEDSGYSFGFEYGATKKRGDWAIGYTYKYLEADAVLGLLADSDFGGGGTDARGHVFSGAYAFHESWIFELTYLVNETAIASGADQDYERLQLDLSFKYR